MKSRRALFEAYNQLARDDYFLHGIATNLIQKLWHTRKYEKVFSLIDGERGSLLDVGCGNGIFCHAALAKGYDAVGVDFSLPFLRRAKVAFSELQVVLADASTLPFRDGLFDVVVSMETLEHVQSLERTAQEIRRVVRPQGVCVTFNQDDSNPLWKLSWFLWQRSTGAIWENLHLTEISPQMLSAALAKQGLVAEKVVGEHLSMSFAIKARNVSC
jgi:ubiquinone/menaquinone biosynthesis C-methylase UbiE